MDWESFGWSEGIAVLALLVSIVSWRSAKASAEAARQANFLQLHNHRKELYLAFHDLYYQLLISAHELDMRHVNAFFEHSKTCYLYVSNDLASEIKGFYDKCFDVARKNDLRRPLLDQLERLSRDPYYKEHSSNLRDKCLASVDEARDMALAAGPIGKSALEALKNEISTQQSRPSRWHKLIELYWKPFNWDE